MRIAGDDNYNRSARNNSAIARIAQPCLTKDTLTLIDKYYDNDDAISFLGRLVWQGEMTECVPALAADRSQPRSRHLCPVSPRRGP